VSTTGFWSDHNAITRFRGDSVHLHSSAWFLIETSPWLCLRAGAGRSKLTEGYRMKRRSIILILGAPIISAPAVAVAVTVAADQVVHADWSDPNFAFCEDVGIHASGRVQATAKVGTDAGIRKLKSLIVTTTHSHAHKVSGSIEWIAADGSRKSTALQAPWFDVMSTPGAGQFLVLPRRGNVSGPDAQTRIALKPGASLTIKLTLVFVTSSGSCPTSFSQNLLLPT